MGITAVTRMCVRRIVTGEAENMVDRRRRDSNIALLNSRTGIRVIDSVLGLAVDEGSCEEETGATGWSTSRLDSHTHGT